MSTEDVSVARPGHFPEDMPEWQRDKLRCDMMIFGTAFYEVTDDGYQRHDPTDTVVRDARGANNE